jgi:hypothetical protein
MQLAYSQLLQLVAPSAPCCHVEKGDTSARQHCNHHPAAAAAAARTCSSATLILLLYTTSSDSAAWKASSRDCAAKGGAGRHANEQVQENQQYMEHLGTALFI